MMKTLIFSLLFSSVLYSCSGKTDKQQRRVYLKEHVENCDLLIGRHFAAMEKKRVSKPKTALNETVDFSAKACKHFYGFLHDTLYRQLITEGEIRPQTEQHASVLQNRASRICTGGISSFFLARMGPLLPEEPASDESPELRTAKRFTNALLIAERIMDRMRLYEELPARIAKNRSSFLLLQVPADTFSINEKINASASACFREDLRDFVSLKNIRDLRIVFLNPETGRFKAIRTGTQPRFMLIRHNVYTPEETAYEIRF